MAVGDELRQLGPERVCARQVDRWWSVPARSAAVSRSALMNFSSAQDTVECDARDSPPWLPTTPVGTSHRVCPLASGPTGRAEVLMRGRC